MYIGRLFEFLKRQRFLIQAAFVVVVLALYVWLIQDQRGWVKGIEDSVLQWRMEIWPAREVPKDIVILGVYDDSFTTKQKSLDAATLAHVPELAYMTNAWPWNRELWARLTDRLLGAGAKLVVYDFVFNGPTPGDAHFGAVLAKDSNPKDPQLDKVVIASQLGGTVPGSDEMIIEPERTLVTGPEENSVGLIKLAEDAGLIRSIQHHYDLSTIDRIERARNLNQGARKHSEYSLSWVAAKKALGMAPVRDADRPMPLNYYGPDGSIETIPLQQVLLNWDTTYKHGDYFKDKYVFVGPYAETRFYDYYETPLDNMAGVEIQATAFANLIHNEWLTEAPDWLVLALALALGLLALAVSVGVRSVVLKMGLFASLAAFYLAATQHIFWTHLIVMPVAGAALILVSVGVFGTLYDFVLEQYERQRTLGMFESMVSPGVAGLVLNDQGDFQKRLGGQKQEVVVLFGDIRGFTAWSEHVGPDALVAQLNEHLSRMVEIVQEEGGTVQKYIGDALMAAWGDVRTLPPAEGAERAVRAGLRMQAALRELNTGWKGQAGRQALTFGIGINHGEGLVGRIGHPRRQEFTVMGDAVNVASRLESATKQYRQEILVGQSVYEMTKKIFWYRLADQMRVFGKKLPVRVYVPLAEQKDGGPPLGWLAYTEALEKYYAREFAGAAAGLREANQMMGGQDWLCLNYIERCEHFLYELPPVDWDGTWVLKDK
jgi:adenylate cyclase